MPQTTVYDVAKRAGISITTVSRVLNAPEKVSVVTRQRVLTAIDELGFIPKAEAAARARKNSGRIGVLAPFFTYLSFVQRLRGVASMLDESPYELTIYSVDSSARRDGYLATLPVTRRLDGLIVMALPFDEAAAQRLIAHGLETVLLESCMAPFSSICINDRAGGAMAARYLLEQGHRRCAFVGDTDLPDYAIHTSEWRLEGYRQALADAEVPVSDQYVALGPHSREAAWQSTHYLLNLPVPPTAIFAASDNQALGVLKAARDRGLSVPRDLAVIGFDDLDIAEYIGLTTIRQHLEESGRLAVNLLLERLINPARPVQRIELPLTLVRRETA